MGSKYLYWYFTNMDDMCKERLRFTFDLSFIARYSPREVHNLARFVSIITPQPLTWRTSHPYVLADRLEDVTPPEKVQMDKKCDRNITLYGYLRGCNFKKGMKVCMSSNISSSLFLDTGSS